MHGRQSPAYGASSLRARSRDPRGAYAPRSWSCRRSCIAKVAFSPSREGRPPGAAGVSPPWLDDAHARKIANRKWVHIHAASGAAGVSPPCVAVATPQRRSTRHSHAAIAPGNSSGGRQPAVCCADALAKALPQLFGRLSPVRWRTPLQSRPCNYAGLTPPALGRARSPVDAIATFAMHKRTCTRSGGCQPAVVAVATPQQRFTRHSHAAIAPGNRSGVSPPWLDDAHARKIANHK